jgi:hypothetical protein
MKRFRISILGAMGLVLIAGLVLALMQMEQRLVSSGLEGCVNFARYVVVTSLVMATYRARYRKGRKADWWFGFALGGWSYYLFSGDMMWQWSWPTHMPNSLVQTLPHWIVSLIPRHLMDQIVLSNWFRGANESKSYVTRIVQALLVLFAAVVGGLVCLVLSWRRGATPRESDPVVT